MSETVIWMTALIALVIIVALGAIWSAEADRRAAAHAKLCAAHDMKAASVTEHSGKTSTTARFCVNDAGQVFWPY